MTTTTTATAMTPIVFAWENATYQTRNFTEDAAVHNSEDFGGYLAKAQVCHYSDAYDGSLSQVTY